MGPLPSLPFPFHSGRRWAASELSTHLVTKWLPENEFSLRGEERKGTIFGHDIRKQLVQCPA